MAESGSQAASTAKDDTKPQTFRIPDEFLRDTKKEDEKQEDKAGAQSEPAEGLPMIMFINGSSGGHVGPALSKKFSQVVGSKQVFDLSKDKPNDVLAKLFDNLSKAEQAGDSRATGVRNHLRVLACGGDGTVAWVLTTIWNLDLKPPPPVAVIPLGTGNGLSQNFGWGKTMRPEWLTSEDSMKQELQALVHARQRDIDLWKVQLAHPKAEFKDDERPDALQIVEGDEQVPRGMKGMFTYYCTAGVDAEVAYRFHKLRKEHPGIASKRKVNEGLYAGMGVRTGWFCGAKPLRETVATLKVKKSGQDWQEVKLASNIYAILIINLQTYSGGRDVWGLHDSDRTGGAKRPEEAQKGFRKPIFDDGLIEVVGLKTGWHTVVVLAQLSRRIHGKRLAQGNEVMVEFRDSAKTAGHAAYMRLDGEPWMQDISGATQEQPLTVHIKHAGKGSMLINTDKLPGTAQKAMALAEREEQLSNPAPETSKHVQRNATLAQN
ncbi:hypothetical protein WJX73_008031 [Symbiochloris irregularis]|uniref:Diacylglycerol kinase n=1 Tax=Symbiochloris irregularis TaxID=706552 RepID=A0AAW1NUE4_9CHLO